LTQKQAKNAKEKTEKEREFGRLEEENVLLSTELQKQKLIVEQLLQQMKSYQIAQTVFTNTVSLIQFLPYNSSYRRLFLFWFTKGLSLNNSMECYGISKRTYNRLVEQKNSEIVARKYAIGMTKEMITVKTSKRRKNHPVSYKVLKERKNTGLVQVYWGKQKTKYKNAVSTFKLNLLKTWEQINVPEIKIVLEWNLTITKKLKGFWIIFFQFKAVEITNIRR
jgi:hypothetical protein